MGLEPLFITSHDRDKSMFVFERTLHCCLFADVCLRRRLHLRILPFIDTHTLVHVYV